MAASQLLLCVDDTQPVKKTRCRKSHHKVRTGCITCKIRRKKCDETKPSCNRCTSTGRKCDGYESQTLKIAATEAQSPYVSFPDTEAAIAVSTSQVFERSSIHDVLHRTQTRPWQMIPRPPTAQLLLSEVDLQCFDYFRLVTAPQLGSYHENSVWRNFVVRAAFTHPVILKSSAALGAVHRRYGLGITPEAFHYCLVSKRLFNEAMYAFHEFQRQNDGGGSLHEVTMIAKFLHGIFHVFQGDYDLAANSLTEGLTAMWSKPFTKGMSQTTRQSSHAHPQMFEWLYRKMALDAVPLMGRQPEVLADHKSGHLPSIPFSLPTLEHGLDLLYTQVDFLCHVPASIWHRSRLRRELQAKHVSYILRWNAALAETINLMPNRTLQQFRACFLLRRIRTSIYLLLYLVLFLRDDVERKLLDFDMLESDGDSSEGVNAFPFYNEVHKQQAHETLPRSPTCSNQNNVDGDDSDDDDDDANTRPMIKSPDLWAQINQDEDLLTNLSRITVLVNSMFDEDFSVDNYPNTMSINVDSGIGPPRSRVPRPDSSSKTRHLVRSLLDPSLREKVFAETESVSSGGNSGGGTQGTNDSFLSGSMSGPAVTATSVLGASKSSPGVETGANAASSPRLYNVAEQLCSLEEHAVFAAAKRSLIVPKGLQPRWLDVSYFLEERKMLVRYCCRDDAEGVTGPNGGIIWTQEWIKF